MTTNRLSPEAQQAQAAARRSNGEFGEQQHSAPESVQLSTGGTASLVPGRLDDDAREAFQEGQCLAFAVAVAQRHPGSTVAAFYVEDDWDEDEYRLGHAAAVVEQDGRRYAVDSYGWEQLDDWCRGYGIDRFDLEEVPPQSIVDDAGSGQWEQRWQGVPPQNFALAETFTDAIEQERPQ